MATERRVLNKKVLTDLKPNGEEQVIVDEGYATANPRKGTLSVRVPPKEESVTFRIQYRVKRLEGGWKQTKTVIGTWEEFSRQSKTLGDIYQMAKDIVTAAADDGMTHTEREAAARTDAAERKIRDMSIAELGEMYVAGKMDGSIDEPYKDSGKTALRYVKEAAAIWGDKPVTRLDADDGGRLMHEIKERAKKDSKRREEKKMVGGRVRSSNPGAAKQQALRGYLKPMLDYADTLVPADCRVRSSILNTVKVKRNPPKKGVMTAEERKAFSMALDAFEQPQSNRTGRRHDVSRDTCTALRLQYLCAARPSEWLQAQWGDVDLEKRRWRRPEHKRKQGDEHVQLLDKKCISILRSLRARRAREGRGRVGPEDYIFPTTTPRKGKPHRTSHGAAWEKIMDIAGINEGKSSFEKITPHALRASRVTEWHDEHGWPFEKIAKVMGSSVAVVQAVYYRRRYDTDDFLDEIDLESDEALF